MDPIKISAKNLGQTALADFCPRCYWIRLKTNFKLPWQSFPGIFSSIDSYTKSCIHAIIDISATQNPGNKSLQIPNWMRLMGEIVGYEKVPHWSKNTYHDPKSNITLSGAQDDILVCADGTRIVPDYKTAKHTETQDKLFPLYEIQENVYSILSEKDGQSPVKLFLVYMEPCTEPSFAQSNIISHGFRMEFSAVVVPVTRDRGVVRKALSITREIHELATPPKGNDSCKECQALDKIIGLLTPGAAQP